MAGAPLSSTPPRRSFALTGRSVRLDPLTHAVRPDLADVRLADQVFAPHYAEAVCRRLAGDAPLRADREESSAILCVMNGGERFELLDLIGGDAWGIAADRRLVGWLPAASLA